MSTTGSNRDKTGKFQKGKTGNPNGRPAGTGLSITTEIKRKLREVPKGQKKTYLQQLIQTIMDKAIKEKDSKTIKQIWNYIDGLPKQSVDVTSNGESLWTPEQAQQILTEYGKKRSSSSDLGQE